MFFISQIAMLIYFVIFFKIIVMNFHDVRPDLECYVAQFHISGESIVNNYTFS